jgi:hypothetical protein
VRWPSVDDTASIHARPPVRRATFYHDLRPLGHTILVATLTVDQRSRIENVYLSGVCVGMHRLDTDTYEYNHMFPRSVSPDALFLPSLSERLSASF